MSAGTERVKISELKPGMNSVSIRVRVLEAEAPRTINTRKGPRTISEAVVGDETGRTRITLWGHAAGSLQVGDVVEISGAWTTSYRGQVVLNIGGRGNITRVDDNSVPPEDEIPEETPQAPPDWRPPRRSTGGYGAPRRRGYKPRF